MEIFSFCLMLVGVGGGARGWRLVSSWEIGFVRVWVGYISIAAVTAGGSRSRAAGELTLGPVGASLLAMDVNDNAGYLIDRVVQTFFASKLAPTGIFSGHKSRLKAGDPM